jgi:hypothetical protein
LSGPLLSIALDFYTEEPLKVVSSGTQISFLYLFNGNFRLLLVLWVLRDYDVVYIEEDDYSILDHTAWLLWHLFEFNPGQRCCEFFLP